MTLQTSVSNERPKSASIYQASCVHIPGGVNSPVRAFPGFDQTPLVAERGEGAYLWDSDGNRFIDLCGSWGALIHGHAHPEIVNRAKKRLEKGSTFGVTTQVEALLADKICALVPSVEKVRFVSSGTEATMSAARLARGFTGRSRLVKFSGNYHGHSDSFLVQAGSGVAELQASSSAGVPEAFVQYTASLRYNDLDEVRAYFKEYGEEIAAVILEPIVGNMGVTPPEKGFLEGLREICSAYGSLLIFDEVITGFRVSKQGAQGLYGVTPDLTCFGKIVGGGFPLAAFGGRSDVMNYLAPLGPVYQAGTLSGNPVACEAGLAALEILDRPGFYEELAKKTETLVRPLQQLIQEKELNVCLQKVGSLFTLFFGVKRVTNFDEAKQTNQEVFKKFFRYLFEKGIYLPQSQFEMSAISSQHTYEDLDYVREVIASFLSSYPI